MGDLYQRVEEAVGSRVATLRPLSGGCVGEVYGLVLEDGRDMVAKVDNSATPKLHIEGYMLQYLAEHSALPVPQVYRSEEGLLLMARAPGTSQFRGGAEEDAAELLAALHGIQADQYGLEKDTLIGGLHQPNRHAGSWVDFFREHRLLHMSDEALKEGAMDKVLFKRICRFAESLDELLVEPTHPSLLHGDVWTTNVLAENGRITAFIDPAIYYGHPEIELAFITLFNTFGEAFFERYEGLRPIGPGFFEIRKDIYNLYPLLVHARLFGASYLSGVERVLAQHGY